MRTDWYKRNGSEAEFLNANETGPHTPGLTAEAIQFLIGKDIKGWGSETIGTDAGKAGGMSRLPGAHAMHGQPLWAGQPCNLDRLPPKGAILTAAPLKIEHGTGSRSARWRSCQENRAADGLEKIMRGGNAVVRIGSSSLARLRP
jgi:kynurenine formamidase